MNTPPGNNGKMVHYALASESAVLFDSVYCLSYYKKQSPYGFFEYNWGIDGYEAVVLGPEGKRSYGAIDASGVFSRMQYPVCPLELAQGLWGVCPTVWNDAPNKKFGRKEADKCQYDSVDRTTPLDRVNSILRVARHETFALACQSGLNVEVDGGVANTAQLYGQYRNCEGNLGGLCGLTFNGAPKKLS